VIDFLSAILEGGSAGFLELRFIMAGTVKQRFFSLPVDSAGQNVPADALNMDFDGWDVYFGVLPRWRREGKGEDIDDWATVLWADFDAKAYPGGKPAAFYALGKVLPVPQIIVDSGHGYHAYWLMRRGLNWAWAEKIMKGIAIKTGADRTYDKARILRVPGTHNHKDEVPALVRILRFDTLSPRYDGDEFSDYTFAVDREQEKAERAIERRRHERVDMAVPIENIPDWLQRLLAFGHDPADPPPYDRSKNCFRVACKFIELGWSDEEIEDVFVSHPEGIGEKMAEKGDEAGRRWLQYTLRAAHQTVGY
jgi:hypothetical protein